MADVDPERVKVELSTIEQEERESDRQAAARDAAQTEAIVDALTHRSSPSDPS